MSIERTLSYADGDTPLRGYLHVCHAAAGRLPGILLVHGGAGLDAHAREQAGRYADLGYAVLAADIFGPAVPGAGREQTVAAIKALRDDPDTLVRRATAGITALNEAPESAGCFAAVGFCFGGMTVLTLARAGADLAAVVSMHGSLATGRPAEPGAVRARVLACHGARDPHVPMADVAAFSEEMIKAEADWRLAMYGTAVHGFTHQHAVPGEIPGVDYDRTADEESFETASAFLSAATPGIG
ncbi:dienelactone hydrolase family protein [Actinospica robiniae]|uniref:dienelactone hydrolase family protein n=1 Tax=Actinospica robiniae TaxID=304901 RepID=UPI0004063040|nr:dienelactone hydrolase family protein [Actinospica robiniae]